MAGKAPQKAGWTRRGFFNWVLNVVLGAIAILIAIPTVGTLIYPAFAKSPPTWVKLGPADDLQQLSLKAGNGSVGSVAKAPYTYLRVDHWAKQPDSDYAYLRYIGGSCLFFILSPICTHLGCHVNWVQSANQFHCPCHGSVYTIDGTNVSGPAPRPLGVFKWKMVGSDVYIAVESSTFTHAECRTSEADKEPCTRIS
ncbi:Rieske domain-containing protein [Candidatus Hydrogenisulfobacillus filiaventi]|uniref:Rieske domain-containing protein n=1 Tax=Candidatus Hydrogenisulfobacillus filiaventi TaxID=2707344 RepID=A0A6F8ZFF1_9FIRM|nr:ubiquinol-cytochrome c reductase iron-sulfur subunit [Bacillota bacterium]CAB1128507.1 Rieske domain-containing protein [Candidatus Hydrogenisulfobacillus filiaventi]